MNTMSEGELSSIKGGSGFWCGVAAGVVANAIWDFGSGLVDGLNGKKEVTMVTATLNNTQSRN